MLSAFADRAWFCLYKLVPREGGKLDKVPVGIDGRNSNAQDPSTWMLPVFAEAYAGVLGCGTGIVLHPGSQLACIDLDNCVSPTGQLNVFAQTIIAMFPGAFVELSVSRTGVHIFFSYTGDLPLRHGTRGPGLEVYSMGRFMALGTQGSGDPHSDHTAMLHVVLATLVTQPAPAQASVEWTDGPDPEFRGGGTDEQIISSIRSQVQPTETGASGRALWDCDVDALALAYPAGRSGEAYNASAADQALANRLARRTGYDCERTARLLMESGLARGKHEREDYIRRTVLRACDSLAKEREIWRQRYGTEVFESPHAEALRQEMSIVGGAEPAIAEKREPGALVTAAPKPRAVIKAGNYYPMTEMCDLWHDYVWIEELKAIYAADGSMLDRAQMDGRFGGCAFQTQTDGSKPTGSAWDGFMDNKMHRFPRAHGLTFDPNFEPRAEIKSGNKTLINSWLPANVPSQEGDVTLFTNHMKTLLPKGDDAEILTSYFASCVQNPGVKFTWAPFIQGIPGNGKTFFSDMMRACMSTEYTVSVRASELGSKFNAQFDRRLLVIVEDVHSEESSDKVWEALKPMITNKRLEIEYKGVDAVDRAVFFNFIFNANSERGMRKTEDDRRICPLFTAHQNLRDLERDGLNVEYFIRLFSWADKGGYAKIHNYLKNYKIRDCYNPATGCMRAPKTSSTSAAVTVGRADMEQEILHRIEQEEPGFRGGWVSSTAIDRMLISEGRSRGVSRFTRGKMVEALGYVPHPALPTGLCTMLPDRTRPRLYVFHGSPLASLPASEVASCFWKSNGQP